MGGLDRGSPGCCFRQDSSIKLPVKTQTMEATKMADREDSITSWIVSFFFTDGKFDFCDC